MIDRPVLEKLLWTEADYDQMGWHDAKVHAFALNPDIYEVEFDLDYIIKWISPAQPTGYYSLWFVPATLVFENVRSLSLRMEPDPPEFEIVQIEREDPRPVALGSTPWGSMVRGPEWSWRFELSHGEMNFRSTGFRQYFRRPPCFVSHEQEGSRAQRGGISFTRGWDPHAAA